MLLLAWNSMWGWLPDARIAPLPEGWELTTDRARLPEAAAVVFHLPDLRIEAPIRKAPGQLWAAWSMECEVHYPQQRAPAFLRHFDLTMTHRQDSDVWWPYCYHDLHEELRRPALPKTADALVAAFISSGFDRSGRGRLLERLMRLVPVHSYGRFLRNRELQGDDGRPAKLETIARYPFTIAFENAIAEDYVTEKLYDPLVAGSVPVYLGAPNVGEFAPGGRCLIDVREFPSAEALAARLVQLWRDEDEYGSYLKWKGQPYAPEFAAKLDVMREHPFTRLCRLAGQRLSRPPR